MSIDVVIPTYNRLWALKRSVPYYLGQQRVNSVIVVNDGCTDATEEWLRKYCENEPRLKYITHPANRGAPAARNTGALFCKSQLIFFADDDMILKPNDGLSILYEEMEKKRGDVISPIILLPEKNMSMDIVFNSCGKNRHSLFTTILEHKSRSTLVNELNGDTFECVTLKGLMLMKKSVINKVKFITNLGTSAYRDETDFQLRAHKAGFRLLACPKVFLIDFTKQFDKGGCSHSMNRFIYELQVCRNNWRFLVYHKNALINDCNMLYQIQFVQLFFIIYHFGRRIPLISKLISLVSMLRPELW